MNIESNLQLVTNLLTSIITLITIVITGRQGKEKAKDTAERLVSNFLKDNNRSSFVEFFDSFIML